MAVFTRVRLLRSLVTQQEPPDHPLAAALDWHTEVRAERLRGYPVFVRRELTIIVEHQPHILRVQSALDAADDQRAETLHVVAPREFMHQIDQQAIALGGVAKETAIERAFKTVASGKTQHRCRLPVRQRTDSERESLRPCDWD